MTSHAATALLLDNAHEADNSTAAIEMASNDTMIPVTINLTTILNPATTSTKILPTSTAIPLTTLAPVDEDSHFIFAFCTVLFFVGIALVAKIVYSNRKKYRNLAPNIPSWRLSASRASGHTAPAGFALSRDPRARGTGPAANFTSAHYTTIPPSTSARLAANQQQDAFVGTQNHEWERQFFDDETTTDQGRFNFKLQT
jgi:hypothetical protein